MKIAHVINSLGSGGAETLVVNLGLEQRKLGHEVVIFVLEGSEGIPVEKAKEKGLEVIRLGSNRFDPRLLFKLRKVGSSFDIVHVHLFPSLYYFAFGNPGRSNWIYTEHSTENRRRGSIWFRPFERVVYSRPNLLVAISEGAAKSLRSHLKGLSLNCNVSVINNGISNNFLENTKYRKSLPRAWRLLIAGTLDSRKNVQEAIRIVNQLENVTLTIVGDGPQKSDLQYLIQELKLENRVELRAKTSALREVMDRHDVLINTSLYEGFGLVVAEGMARGLPVIVPDVKGVRELVTNCGAGLIYQRNANGEPDIVQIQQFLQMTSMDYRQFSEQSIRFSKSLSIYRTAVDYIRAYEQVLDVKDQ